LFSFFNIFNFVKAAAQAELDALIAGVPTDLELPSVPTNTGSYLFVLNLFILQ
jgi:hypothetical protein